MPAIKCLRLNLLKPSREKQRMLNGLGSEYARVFTELRAIYSFAHFTSAIELHEWTYRAVRRDSFLPCQLVQEATRLVKATIKQNNPTPHPRFNTRVMSFKTTKRGNPVLSLSFKPRKRVLIPIAQDGAWKRFNSFVANGWACSSVVYHNGVIWATIKKDFEPAKPATHHIIGVDVGCRCLAAVTAYYSFNHKIRKQLYFGRDVAIRQEGFSVRRASLQSLADKGSRRAANSLERTKRKQSNFVRNRSYEVAWQIVGLAKKHRATIAIEDLNKLKENVVVKGAKQLNKTTQRLPYRKLRFALESICLVEGVPLVVVNPHNTSRTCYACGTIDKRNRINGGKLFRCVGCGFVANADRVGSVNIAGRAAEKQVLLQDQSSAGQVPVNAPLRSDESRGLALYA
ncbi:MAG: transposase [Candidatus Diapherotrites archaeon]|nr:transposase [Candidatus Diapherotrites archaeon]